MHSLTVLLNDRMTLLFSLDTHGFCGWNQPDGALRDEAAPERPFLVCFLLPLSL